MSLDAVPFEAGEVTLCDLLDTALNRGVVVEGDATISVADVDLVFLGLRLMLCSVESMESERRGRRPETSFDRPSSTELALATPQGRQARPRPLAHGSRPGHPRQVAPGGRQEQGASGGHEPASPVAHGPNLRHRGAADGDRMEQGLAKLVLTLVELLRRTLEQQAIRRLQGGSLSDAQVERMGTAFQRLQSKMEELKRVFGLEGDELNLNLGPLGNLM
jgi:hypothetical protein